MVDKKLSILWKVLKKSDFTCIPESYEDVSCVLCHHVLIDAKQTPCGCRFCGKCLLIYTSSGSVKCPGSSDECPRVILEMEKNISTDYIIHLKLLKLRMRCPNDNCQFEDVMINIADHLKGCGKASMPCPFSGIGCERTFINKDQIHNHLVEKIHKHSSQLLNMMANLTNEVEVVRKENKELKEASTLHDVSVEELRKEIREISEEIRSCNQETGLREWQENNEGNLPMYVKGQFTWKIDNFRTSYITYKFFDSEPFLTHEFGYKMKLRLECHARRRTILSIYPNCVKGPHDSDLKWPFQCSFEIGLLDPATNQYVANTAKVIKYHSTKSPVEGFFFPKQVITSLMSHDVMVRCKWNLLI